MADAGPLKGARVLLPASDLTRDTLADELRAAGAEVTEVPAYRATTVESDAHLDLYRQLLDRRIDAVTFTSANTVRAFVEIYGAEQSPDLLSGTVVATIGPARRRRGRPGRHPRARRRRGRDDRGPGGRADQALQGAAARGTASARASGFRSTRCA